MSENTEKPVVLSLHNCGTPEYPRYMISDQYLRYWTGNDWSVQGDQDSALIYADSNRALQDMHNLMLIVYGQKPMHRFYAPLYIDLFTDKKVSKREITKWLVKVTKLLLDTTNHGNGPIDGSYGTCRIEYGEMKECK
jgi:hypothetical protein